MREKGGGKMEWIELDMEGKPLEEVIEYEVRWSIRGFDICLLLLYLGRFVGWVGVWLLCVGVCGCGGSICSRRRWSSTRSVRESVQSVSESVGLVWWLVCMWCGFLFF